jgi:transposase-like protein
MQKEPEISRHEGRRTHRTYSREFKAEMVSACLQPGASVAALALRHGMNANVVHRWLKEHARNGRHQLKVPGTSPAIASNVAAVEFVQLPLPAAAAEPERQSMEVELRKGSLTLRVTWPASLVADFAHWTAALLR